MSFVMVGSLDLLIWRLRVGNAWLSSSHGVVGIHAKSE